MAGQEELLARRDAVLQRMADLDREKHEWRQHMDAATDDDTRFRLFTEHHRSRQTERDRQLKVEAAHLQVLLDLYEYEYGSPKYSDACTPAFAMDLDVLQDRLCDWLIDVITKGIGASGMSESQRLLLGWCAQLLVSQAANSAKPVYPQEFLTAARSIYAYALQPQVAGLESVIGRNNPDAGLILALSSFPFLEGAARRALPSYVDVNGIVRQPFTVANRTYKKGKPISNLSHTLILLEQANQTSDLGGRLSAVRGEIKKRGISAETRIVSGTDDDLYSIIFAHRNSNLHGGTHVDHVGLGALLLATLVGLDLIRDQFEELNEQARMLIQLQAPADPDGSWSHWVFYPVDFVGACAPERIHCWTTWHVSGRED